MPRILSDPAAQRARVMTPADRRPAPSHTMEWLFLIIVTGLALRIALLPYRWINPDEGAHLMDGQLILNGLVPLVDFQSRQPFYAYLQAALLGAFHGSYLAARVFPVAAIMGTALIVFFIARRLFDERVALLAAAIYTFHPLVVIWSPVVKTEPLTALLSSAAVYFTVRFDQSEDRWHFLALAGATLGLAFYVRESSLAVIFAIVVFLLVTLRRSPQRLLRAYGSFAAGGFAIAAVAAAYYARYMTAGEMWMSGLNPFRFVASAAGTIAAASTDTSAVSQNEAVRLGYQSWLTTLHAVRETIGLNLFLFAGLALSLGLLLYLRAREPREYRRAAHALGLPICWAGALMLAYAYWALHRGYFTQYFGETIPPLAIVLAFVLVYSVRTLAPATSGTAAALTVGGVLVAVFAVHRVHPSLQIPNLLVVLVPAVGVALAYLGPVNWRRWGAMVGLAAVAVVVGGAASWLMPNSAATLVKLAIAVAAVAAIAILGSASRRRRAAYGALVLLVVTLVSGTAASGRVMNVAFYCVWSPATVAGVARFLRAHTAPGDQVMSGAVIWAVAAKRPPFMMISHPLAFDGGAPPDEAARMRAYLHARPPQAIVLDDYTDRVFLSYLDADGSFLAAHYTLEQVVQGSRHPVRIYTLNERTLSALPVSATQRAR